MSDIKRIAIITNYNIQEKLSAAMKVAEKLCEFVNEIYIPETYRDRIMRARMHRAEFSYKPLDDLVVVYRFSCSALC